MTTQVITASAKGPAANAAKQLVMDLKKGLGAETPALIMAFASTEQPLSTIAPILTEAFPGTTVLGASTAGEFTEHGDTKGAGCAGAGAGAVKGVAGTGTGGRESPGRAVLEA